MLCSHRILSGIARSNQVLGEGPSIGGVNRPLPGLRFRLTILIAACLDRSRLDHGLIRILFPHFAKHTAQFDELLFLRPSIPVPLFSQESLPLLTDDRACRQVKPTRTNPTQPSESPFLRDGRKLTLFFSVLPRSVTSMTLGSGPRTLPRAPPHRETYGRAKVEYACGLRRNQPPPPWRF